MGVRAETRVAVNGVAECYREGIARARRPLTWTHLPAIVFLVGIASDTLTTCFVNLVPGVMEGNPGALAGMRLFGSPQAYMLFALLLLAPLTLLVAGRPRNLLSGGIWTGVLVGGLFKLALGVSNTVLLIDAATR